MDKFLERFSNFFVRSVAPSSIFFVLLFFNDMYFNGSEIKNAVVNITKAEDKKETPKEISLNIKDLKISEDKEQIIVTIDKLSISDNIKKSDDKSKDTITKSNENPNINLIYIFIALIFIAYGYVNQILTQILDNFIKSNYDNDDVEFKSLREKVKTKFIEENNTLLKDENEFLNDYNLYQILGREKSIAPNNNYVDEVKNINSFIVAILLNLIFALCFEIQDGMFVKKIFFTEISFGILSILFYLIITVFVIIFVIEKFKPILYLQKKRYKSRNKRLYINYLLKEDKPNKQEKEIKIKSIKVEVDE